MKRDFDKTVLVIAYYFPPLAMGGVQRIAKFCKYLPEHGWKPVVLTSVPRGYFALDTSLADELKETTVFEARSLIPFSVGTGESFENWRSRLRRIARWVMVPDVRVLWIPWAMTVGFRLLSMFEIDCILATAPPYSSLLVARLLSHRTGLPLVIDFRDPWADDPFGSFPTVIHRRLNVMLEGWVASAASRITSVSEETISGLRRRWNGEDERYRIVSQGFDPADFEQVVEQGQRFVICHTGSLIRGRKPDDLFYAVSQMIAEGKLDPTQVEVDIVGFCPASFVTSAKSLGLEEVVKFTGYISHAASVRHLLKADILWLCVAETEAKSMMTGKLFEYLGSRKRIIASVPEKGGAAAVVRSLDAGVVVRPGDIDGLKRAIREFYGKWLRGEQIPEVSDRVNIYDRRLLAGELAKVLDEVRPSLKGDTDPIQ